MAKFCGNCGTQLDDTAKVCGNCGTPLDAGKGGNGAIPGVNVPDPAKKAKTKKTIKLVLILAVLAVVAIIAVNIVSGFVGYKGVVREIMNAYEDYDVEALYDLSSEFYYNVDQEMFEDSIVEVISNQQEEFENNVGHKYKLSYEILEEYEMSERKRRELEVGMALISDFDMSIISEIKEVDIEITATQGKKSQTSRLTLTLSEENGEWRLLILDED